MPSRPASRGVRVHNPNGQHHIAVGLDAPLSVDILGHAGYFIAGMNKQADVTVEGNVGWSVAENMMSGTVRVRGYASNVPAHPDMAACSSSRGTRRRAAASR